MTPNVGNLPEYDVAELCVQKSVHLKALGIYLQQSTDFAEIEAFADQIEKPSITPFLSPTGNDFFSTNCFWVLARTSRENGNEPLGMIGIRKDNTGVESVAEFSERKLRTLFPTEREIPIRPDRLPSFAHDIKGEVVYMGDLHFAAKRNSKLATRDNVRLFITVVYCLIQLKWPSLNWIYAFIREEDARKSALWIYRARNSGAFAHSWTQSPSVIDHPHWLLASNKSDLEELLTGEILGLKRDGVIQYP